MDLNQRKLTKSEWNSIEKPVSEEEKEVLKIILQGFHNVSIRYNKHNSLFGYLKIEYGEAMEDYLYNKYFAERILAIKTKYEIENVFNIISKSNPSIKKADLIRIEKNSSEKIKGANVFEYLLIEIIENIYKTRSELSLSAGIGKTWLVHYFTLYKLIRVNIPRINRHISLIVANVLNTLETEMNMYEVISNAVEFIEKNSLLLKYDDISLYEHQKELFALMKQNTSSLTLYIAPTGTGKTLSPIGLSEKYKVIFVCAARHVGLALARSAIALNKKIAFAFGCSSADEIRLHYYSAKEFTVNKRSGGIGKVDNSVGDKVEIMICDIKSYLPAMFYMKSFNSLDNLLVYWDEPTITMDYDNHDLHETIKKNWSENQIPTMILSSATLPKLHELSDTIADFKDKFSEAQINNIVSNDCKKSIPIVNKSGYVILPHYISDDYSDILKIVEHCEKNLTILRYFDLNEVVKFIMYVESNDLIPSNMKIERHFACIDDINMKSIKIHYLRIIKKINPEKWFQIFTELKEIRTRKIVPNNGVDLRGNKIKKSISIGPGITSTTSSIKIEGKIQITGGMKLTRLASEQSLLSDSSSSSSSCKKEIVSTISTSGIVITQEEQTGIYITTKDAFTMTDGPTIFLANDVEKIAKFYIQQSNIPVRVMADILEKIEFNNSINEKINILENELEDLESKSALKDDSTEQKSVKKQEVRVRTATGSDGRTINKIQDELEKLRSMIKCAQLNETFIPNKELHLKKWAEHMNVDNVFTSDIEEAEIVEIMTLNDVADSWKVLLLMGIGVFTNHPSIAYTEIMKTLADKQKLFMIIASSDYIYGTNYQFCNGYLSKDLTLTQEKIIQALGRIGRNNIQQNYSVRFRDDEQVKKLFYEEIDKPEVRNMNLLFNS